MRRKVINVLVILVLAISLCLITAAPAGAATPTTIASSTMIFEGPLTPDGDGFAGVLPLIDEAVGPLGDGETGFDVYARNGAIPFFADDRGLLIPPGGSGVIIDHDAYPTWDPDVPDWDYYALILDSGTWKLVYNENNPRDFADTGAVPMSGTMDWAGMYAAETDVGYCFGYDAATLAAAEPGIAAENGGGAAAWDMDWIWGTDVVPLQYAGFNVNVEALGGGNYRVTLTPGASQNVGMSTQIGDLVSISVTPGGIDFGVILPGADISGNTLTVANEGNVAIDVTAELLLGDVLFTTYLQLNSIYGIAGAWTADNLGCNGLGVSGTSDISTDLVGIPANYAPGIHTDTLVFWAEAD
jgi:hypothetical protein